jgi:hypothetical protein
VMKVNTIPIAMAPPIMAGYSKAASGTMSIMAPCENMHAELMARLTNSTDMVFGFQNNDAD